ncbi:MAG: DUF362 domain-containing protein [archaeon]
MAKVTLLKEQELGSFEQALEAGLKSKFKSGMKVAVKLHMGEGKGMFSPDLAMRSVVVLKKLGCEPFLFDTPALYPGPRHQKESYKALAAEHGFSDEKIGCPVVISDDYVAVKTAHMVAEVSKEMAESDAMLILTHVKGHPCSGFGGAIKNLAMGCVSKKSKKDQHKLGMPRVNDNCIACGICATVCPFKAIKVDERAVVSEVECWGCDNCYYNCPNSAIEINVSFDTLLAEAAFAASHAIKGKPVYYVNDARHMTKVCDCFKDPGKPVVRDVGVLLSDDLVAVDKASLDLIEMQEGRDAFKEMNHHDPYLSVVESEKLKLGKQDYTLD